MKGAIRMQSNCFSQDLFSPWWQASCKISITHTYHFFLAMVSLLQSRMIGQVLILKLKRFLRACQWARGLADLTKHKVQEAQHVCVKFVDASSKICRGASKWGLGGRIQSMPCCMELIHMMITRLTPNFLPGVHPHKGPNPRFMTSHLVPTLHFAVALFEVKQSLSEGRAYNGCSTATRR